MKPKSRKWGFAVIVGLIVVTTFSTTLFVPTLDALQNVSSSSILHTPQPVSFRCKVASVHDGDSLRCADGTRIRLHAVSAREIDGTCLPGHPCPSASASDARAVLVGLVRNSTITCIPTGRSYDRVTAICRTDARVEINCAMVRSGTVLIWNRHNREAPICRS